jgi:hypothetical protein
MPNSTAPTKRRRPLLSNKHPPSTHNQNPQLTNKIDQINRAKLGVLVIKLLTSIPISMEDLNPEPSRETTLLENINRQNAVLIDRIANYERRLYWAIIIVIGVMYYLLKG